MSELKVNTISEVTGANGVVVDSVKLKDGGIVIADAANIGSASDTDALAISSGGVVTFTQKPVINSGVTIDNITIDGTEIDLSSGDLTLDVAGDIILDADGGDVKINDGGTAIAELTNSSTDFVIKSVTSDKDIIFKGNDGGAAITALTLDMSGAGAATFNNAITSGAVITSGAGLVIADTGNIGSASDTDAIAIAANGVVTFSQAPVFPDGSLAVADLDIDGATDIGAAIVDADLFVIDDGAGGTNRKTTAARLKTYIGSGLSEVDQFRLSSNLTTSGGVITANLERVDTPDDPHLGTGMSESSGLFSFPSTGIYLIQAQGYFFANVSATYVGINIEVTTNNSSYSSQSQGQNWLLTGASRYINTYVSLLLKVANTTNTKVRFNVNTDAEIVTSGATGVTYTGFTFLKLGDI